ncbi:hypothetical protein GGS21DRAFT_489625, partial [Xylaria nigripes]
METSSDVREKFEDIFPNPLFNYGAALELSVEDCQALPFDQPATIALIQQRSRWVKKVKTNLYRSLIRNRLGFDEKVLRANMDSPPDYWFQLLKRVHMQSWVDQSKVISYLALARPLEKPSNSKLWRLACLWIDEAERNVKNQGWSDEMTFSCANIDDALFEALRLNGDTSLGFGAFPTTLRKRLKEIGAAWFLVNPEHRVIPACWQKWADRAHIKYAGCVSIFPSSNNPTSLKRKRSNSSTGNLA